MVTPISKIVMVNRAMARAGVGSVDSLDDDVPGGEAAGLIYDGVTEFLIGSYPFTFSFVWGQLSRVSNAAPFTGFKYLFKLPGNRLELPKQYSDDMTVPDRVYTDLVVNGDFVHANTDVLYARAQFAVDPVQWTATFREAHTLYLASEFAGATLNNDKRRSQLRDDAIGTPTENFLGGALGLARRRDAQNTPPRQLQEGSNPLLQAWQGGAG